MKKAMCVIVVLIAVLVSISLTGTAMAGSSVKPVGNPISMESSTGFQEVDINWHQESPIFEAAYPEVRHVSVTVTGDGMRDAFDLVGVYVRTKGFANFYQIAHMDTSGGGPISVEFDAQEWHISAVNEDIDPMPMFVGYNFTVTYPSR